MCWRNHCSDFQVMQKYNFKLDVYKDLLLHKESLCFKILRLSNDFFPGSTPWLSFVLERRDYKDERIIVDSSQTMEWSRNLLPVLNDCCLH